MINYVFGAQGAGKSTYGAYIAKKALRRGRKVYSNYEIVGCTLIDSTDLGYYSFENSTIILDECGIDFSNRDFKKGLMNDKDRLEYIKKIRHYGADMYILSQGWDEVDKKLRDLAQRYFLIRKAIIFSGLTLVRPVFKKCDIDDNTHEPCDYFVFGLPTSYMWIWRRPLYKMFNSFERKELPQYEWKPVTSKRLTIKERYDNVILVLKGRVQKLKEAKIWQKKQKVNE